jgi:hypothetical protein
MAAITAATVIGAVGLAASVAGGVTQYVGQQKQARASARAERLRKMQMNLEAARKRREQIRQMLISQGMIANNAANSGVGQTSSGVLGGTAAVGTNTAYNNLGVDQGESIGSDIFAANEQVAQAGGTVAAGSGLQQFGGQLVNNSEAGGRVASSLFSIA